MAIIPVFQKNTFHVPNDDCSSNDDRLFDWKIWFASFNIHHALTIHTTNDASSEVSRKS